MEMDDSVNFIKQEVVESMDKLRICYEKWKELRDHFELTDSEESKTNFESQTFEIRNQITSLESEIEKIQRIYPIAYEHDADKAKLSQQEVAKDVEFIGQTNKEIESIKKLVFDSRYNLKEESNFDPSASDPKGFYSIAFIGTGKKENRYKRLDEEPSSTLSTFGKSKNKKNKDYEFHIDIDDHDIPSNDLRFAREVEEMIEEESGYIHGHNNYDYTSGFQRVYQPPLNMIRTGPYDSPLKNLVRAFPSSIRDKRVYTLFAGISLLLLLASLVCLN